jgi:iron complex transport system substrate-binding protein
MKLHKLLLILTSIGLSCCCFCGCGQNKTASVSTQKMQEITDMAGRSVTIPETIDKVYSTGQPGVVILYTLCPDKLLGWDLKLSVEEEDYINAKYLSLPVLGLMQGGNSSANKEEIMERGPDIVLLMTAIDESTKETADELQETMNIPVVIADYNLENLSNTYEFLGKILNEKDRAKTLSDYCNNTIQSAKETTAKIKQEDLLTVYYAQGSDGLQTAPKGSVHSEVIDLVGGDNVVELEADSDGRLNINMEQLLLYNPDVIIASYSMDHDTGGEGVFSIISNSSKEWKLLEAVKGDRVYSTPCFPYNWLDMPPSVNRMIGIKWLGNLLYPQYYQYDIKEEIKEFYSLFYQKELKDEELDNLLQGAIKN